MNSDAFAFLLVGLAVCALSAVAGAAVGQDVEQKRLYDKCIRNNTTMVYSEVVAMCKDQVK